MKSRPLDVKLQEKKVRGSKERGGGKMFSFARNQTVICWVKVEDMYVFSIFSIQPLYLDLTLCVKWVKVVFFNNNLIDIRCINQY